MSKLSHGNKTKRLISVTAILAGVALAVFVIYRAKRKPPITLQGAVISASPQAEKELPVSGAEIIASVGEVSARGKSDSSGFFKLTLPGNRTLQAPIKLEFRHVGYQPLVLPVIGGEKLYVARMTPTARPRRINPSLPLVTVANISVRYSATTRTAINVGSTVKTFQVVNAGNVPCNHQKPCSPDGKWKAAEVSFSLDAGEGNVFRNARVSCIAGPCPFTTITPEKFPGEKRTLKVTALDWSDTATFLVEAEVFHPLRNAEVRKSYPVIFGQVLDFTLPASAEGICIEADVHGRHFIFPLGPDPVLPWADCSVRNNPNGTKAYRCGLKEGYRF